MEKNKRKNMVKCIITIPLSVILWGAIVMYVIYYFYYPDFSCNEYKQKIIILEKKIAELEKNGYSTSNMDENSRRVMKNINDFIAKKTKDDNYPNKVFKDKFKSFINNFDSVEFNVTFKRNGMPDINDIYTGDSIFIIMRENPNMEFKIISFDAINEINKTINSKNINIVIQ